MGENAAFFKLFGGFSSAKIRFENHMFFIHLFAPDPTGRALRESRRFLDPVRHLGKE
jgi:hypothetical protein